ncbi:MAG: FecR domain-containing protein [Planctomycetota bacterium]
MSTQQPAHQSDKPLDRDELLGLIDASCEERCSDQQIERLEKALLESADARRLYVRYRDMHAALRWHSASAEDLAGGPASPGVQPLVRPAAERAAAPRPPRWELTAAISAGLAASIAAFIAGGYVAGERGQSAMAQASGGVAQVERPAGLSGADGALAQRAAAYSRPDTAAHVTGLVDCRWAPGDRSLRFGQPVAAGQQIELDDGLVQLTFVDGAKVILQGPARFLPRSPQHADLQLGKLAAIVPEQARGYTVRTPTAEVVDLGTEFGIDVSQGGVTEVHVLDGDVIARKRDSGGGLAGKALHARKLDALRFGAGGEDAEWISAQPDRFARQITPKLSREQLPPIPVADGLNFWVAADLLVSRDADRRVSAWRDVCVGDNQIANDACQFDKSSQPVWVADSGSGRPAVRFNGQSSRLRTDAFATGDSVTVFVACSPSQTGQNDTRWAGQLLTFGGKAPTVEINVRQDNGVYTGLWAADAVGTKFCDGVIHSPARQQPKPMVICYTYDLLAERAEQWVNGRSQGAAAATLRAATNSTRTIGGHGDSGNLSGFFRGDIYEVAVFDAALPSTDREAMTAYLMQRHGIAAD